MQEPWVQGMIQHFMGKILGGLGGGGGERALTLGGAGRGGQRAGVLTCMYDINIYIFEIGTYIN